MSKCIKLGMILVLLTACQTVNPPDPTVFDDPIGEVITEALPIHTVWQNPVTVATPTTGTNETTTVNGLQIDGLTNATAQQRINEAIQAQIDVYLAMTQRDDLPLIRGLYQRLDEKAVLQQRQVYSNLTYSLNGVLSVQIATYLEFKNPSGDNAYVYLMEGLTFDCATGESLRLSDLLINGIDGSAVMRTAANEVLDELNAMEPDLSGGFFFDPITLVQPFQGIRADQNFVLTDSGIQLILDHRTPEFDTHGSVQTLEIPYALVIPNLALTQRFDDPEAFDSPITNWQLFQTQDTRMVYNRITIPDSTHGEGLRIAFPRHLSEALRVPFVAQQEALVDWWTSIVQTYPGIYVEGSLSNMPVGPYTCLHGSAYAYHESEVLSESSVTCYDETGEVLSRTHLFKPDFDGEAFLRQAIVDEIVRSGYYHPGFDVDEALDHLQITLQLDGLSCYTFAHAPGYSDAEYLYLFISFASIGVDHVTLLKPTP